jgi:hypothetical protein
VGDGVYRLDAGARLDDFFPCLQASAGLAVLDQVPGTALHRERRPCGPSLLRDGLKTVVGRGRLHARPGVRCSDEARRPLVGCKAQQVRPGVGPRGRTTRPGERPPGPRCPETLATTVGQGHVRDLAALGNGAIRALAQAGGVGQRGAGMAAGRALETPHRDPGGGQATRQRRRAETWGRGQASWAGPGGVDRTAGNGGGGEHGAADGRAVWERGPRAPPPAPRRRGPPAPGGGRPPGAGAGRGAWGPPGVPAPGGGGHAAAARCGR